MVVFSFIHRLCLLGNLLGIASIATYVVLSFLFGANYLEIILVLLITLAIYFLFDAVRRRLGK